MSEPARPSAWDLHEARLQAVDAYQATVSFSPDGTILRANERFLDTVGYDADELVGQHHRMLVPPALAASREYARFWERLASGEALSGVFERVNADGERIWLRATYAPVLDAGGVVIEVYKVAADVSREKGRALDDAGQLAALDRAQAIISFDVNGTILHANANFLSTMGYALHEIVGRHHRTFVDPMEMSGPEYARFWETLRSGEYVSGEFRRRAKDGREVWLQAAYNPILDESGRVLRVVKFATDITDMVEGRHALSRETTAIVEKLEQLAAGDLTVHLPIVELEATRRMLGAVSTLRDALHGKVSDIARRAVDLGQSARDLRVVGEALTDDADTASSRAETASVSAGHMGEEAESVAAGIEEMDEAVAEVARHAANATDMAHAAVSSVTEANGAVERLGQSSREIGDVVKVITAIAQQTNLLALNATIEAARAGNVGKGFAVVAGEVKSLAQETALATRNIEQRISAIQGDTTRVVEAMAGIRTMVAEVAALQGSIAAAVEEQTATTGEMSRSARSLSATSQALRETLTTVTEAALRTAGHATRTRRASTDLASMATSLQDTVSTFRT